MFQFCFYLIQLAQLCIPQFMLFLSWLLSCHKSYASHNNLNKIQEDNFQKKVVTITFILLSRRKRICIFGGQDTKGIVHCWDKTHVGVVKCKRIAGNAFTLWRLHNPDKNYQKEKDTILNQIKKEWGFLWNSTKSMSTPYQHYYSVSPIARLCYK